MRRFGHSSQANGSRDLVCQRRVYTQPMLQESPIAKALPHRTAALERVKVTKLSPVRLELHCAVAGCAGMMACYQTDRFGSLVRAHHRCSMCGITESLAEEFPRIEMREDLNVR